ncbi:BglG family transcription antiterminator [Paenibacillus terrae]|uniref:Uncharacterized protein n=1 Tax=Paenibacillus terrae TaxID=159743 RepID=A0A0D7X851_9BACL|nr:BglG family transcription antiterminator [Paenibacillus terrae]KJD47294.1 hypothetical protein QD47_01860 [Paenibacillus terrae]
MNNRQISILLRILFGNDPLTGSSIAKEFLVSARTVRSDIKLLNNELSKYKVQIHSSKQVGYYIEPRDKKIIRGIFEEFNLTDQETDVPNTPIERTVYIVLKLLFSTDYITMETIADDIYVSKTTINYDIKRVSEVVHSFPSLQLTVSQTKGLLLSGNEISKRALLYHALQQGTTGKHLEIMNRIKYLFKEPHVYDDLIEFQKLVMNMLNSYGYFLTDQDIFSLFIDFFISMKRSQTGFIIDQQIEEELDPDIVKIVLAGMSKLMAEPEENELKYLQQRFQSKRLLNVKNDDSHTQNQEAVDIVKHLLVEIRSKFGINFLNNENLTHNLIQHISPLIYRLKTHTFEINPLKEETRRKYPFAFELSNVLVPIIKERYGLTINESELTYISLHLAVALEEVFDKPVVAIMCGSGLGTAQLLYRKLLSYYGERLNILGWYSMYQLEQVLNGDLGQVDFIVTTVPIEADTSIPVLQVNPLLNRSDLNKIEKYLQSPIRIHSQNSHESGNGHSFFSEGLFEYVRQPGDYFQVLRTLTANLLEQHMISDGEEFYQSVIEREQMQSTVLANLIALPHAMDYISTKTAISVGVLEEPIKHEGRKIKLVMLVAINPKEKEELNRLYSMIERILETDHVKALTSAENFQAFMANLM